MKNIEIKGLLFVQTHDSDPARYDVRDADFKRVAYVEWDGAHLVCTTPGPEGEVLYKTNVTKKYVELCFACVADMINEHIAKNSKSQKSEKFKAKTWKITGYKGWDNWDGPEDNNMNFTVVMDARFKKEDVEEIFANRFSKKHRVVVVEATEIACFNVERNDD